MKRREFLLAAPVLSLSACKQYGPRIVNPCKTNPPEEILQSALVRSALSGLDAAQIWDGHVHLIGTGDSDSGIWLHPHMRSVFHPLQNLQFRFYLNAACVDRGDVDRSYVKRLLSLKKDLPGEMKLVLLAFDYTYDENGIQQPELSAFHTPNAYTASVAAANPQSFEWIASVHPYRRDAIEKLLSCISSGAVAIKWLPPAMGIDPSSPLCEPFYEAMRVADIPLLVHSGEEKAVHGAARDDFANPLLLRKPLDMGVRVIVAHCASLGSSNDLESGQGKSLKENFELFSRLMQENQYEGLLFGEISAMTQVNRLGSPLNKLIQNQHWHHRLINASDYPLPAVMPLFSLKKMVAGKYISVEEAEVLAGLREYNALLFDLVLKRSLRVEGAGFQDVVFHSRRLFQRK